MAESSVLEDFTNGEFNKSCIYFKTDKKDNLKTKIGEKLIKGLIDPNAMRQTDESTTFSNFENFIDVHMMEISSSKEGEFNKKCAHKVIRNLKISLTKYKMVSEKKFQNYLDEFYHKLNRRYFDKRLFDRLIIASIHPY